MAHPGSSVAAIVAVAVLGGGLVAQDRSALSKAVAALRAAPALAGAHLGVAVVDIDTGERLVAHDAELAFAPASNHKLLTAAVALATLGADATLRTTVTAAEAPRDGVIAGDLRLCGGGDPALGGRLAASPAAPMQALAEQIHAAGVRRVLGRVVGDPSLLPESPYGRGWQWDYLAAGYAAPRSGLCYHENVVEIWLQGTGVPGALATLRTVPEFGLPPFTNEVRCGERGAAADLLWQAPPVTNVARIRGTLAADSKPVRMLAPVADPARFAAEALRAALVARGVVVDGEAARHAQPAGAAAGIELAHLESPPVRDLLRPVLKDSVNLYAEQLWRLSALRGRGAAADADCEQHALATLAQFGLRPPGLVVADGSGLSRRNLVTAQHLATLLRELWRGPHGAVVADALPIAGRDGSLAQRLGSGVAAGRVLAKTGSIDYVLSLSGYLPCPQPGKAPLAFAILLNGVTADAQAATDAIDACVEAFARAAGWASPSR